MFAVIKFYQKCIDNKIKPIIGCEIPLKNIISNKREGTIIALCKNYLGYKNLIKQDDLGSMGIWYKLRIGPFDDRSTAKKLCSSLRDEGLPGCIVVELE